MALVINRRQGQAIRIGPNITITLGETRGSYTSIHVDAPKSLPVWRAEIENFYAGGDGDDICGSSVSARADSTVDDGVSSTSEHRASNTGDA